MTNSSERRQTAVIYDYMSCPAVAFRSTGSRRIATPLTRRSSLLICQNYISRRISRFSPCTRSSTSADLRFVSGVTLAGIDPYQSDSQRATAMATARKVHLSLADSGVVSHKIREDSARTTSEVLQDDMEKHHVFFNDSGFHNHIPHHLLSIYALGASPDEIKTAYASNKSYQRPVPPVDETVVNSLHDKERFRKCLGRENHYSNFLTFFQKDIDEKGVEAVLKEYLFCGDENAESMLERLFGGLTHPFIHFNFGIEFNQPAIIAQGLAQTAVHEDWIGPLFFQPVEKAAGGIGKPGKKSMLQILEEIRADKKLMGSSHWTDSTRMKNGVLKRASDEMIKYAAEFTVSADQVEQKIAEIINTVAYYASAAQRPGKQIKFDFFYIHGVNSSIFLSQIASLPFLEDRTKLRLLEWTGRLDLMLYVAYGAPDLRLEEVTNYPATRSWESIFRYSTAQSRDDGHLPKLVRALKNGERVCRPFEAQAQERGLKIMGDMWLKIANMVMDSTRDQHARWVRGAGFDEAWDEFGGRDLGVAPKDAEQIELQKPKTRPGAHAGLDGGHVVIGAASGAIPNIAAGALILLNYSRSTRVPSVAFSAPSVRETYPFIDTRSHRVNPISLTMPHDEDSTRNRDPAPAASDSRQWPDDENPFVAFRRFADEQVSSMLQSVMGIPSMSSRPSTGRWAVFEQQNDNDPRFHPKDNGDTKGLDDAPGSGSGAANDSETSSSHNNNSMRQSRQWSEWQDPRLRRSTYDHDVDFFDVFFDRFWPDEYHHPRFFQPHYRPMLSGMAKPFPWPMGYILFNPYSPLNLERQAHSQHHGVFSSLMSSLSHSSECDPAEPQWRDAFEDLIRLENGKPMLDRDQAAVTKPEHWGTWLSGLVNRGSLGDKWKPIRRSELDAPAAPGIAFEGYEYEEDDTKRSKGEEAVAENAKSETNWNETGSEAMTEQDLYDRFLDDLATSERELSRTVFNSPLLRLILQDTQRPQDTQNNDTENLFELASSRQTASVPDIVPEKEPQPASESTAEKTHVISTLMKTNRVRLADGSILTKTVQTKRFADGREESNEFEEVVKPQQAQLAEAPSPTNSQEESTSEQKSGWFWKS
ncbi:hypothetical protein BO71DRAFT_482315 [Aspergillus ellipticus CBS 707.79]|uniref:HypA-like protein n=1 Tax=Aspergillus ellipticus CBS 707.79 TaxID=1448320 RepID=A0A319DG36_9EURO|nr:hypothetical protein BO71DRAFT_482315 [Aspergillus ellipticus CBS 707.79]